MNLVPSGGLPEISELSVSFTSNRSLASVKMNQNRLNLPKYRNIKFFFASEKFSTAV